MEIKLFFLTIIGLMGGFLGRYTRIPGGVLLTSMIFTSLANAKGIHLSNLPFVYVLSLQVLAGVLVGQKVTVRILKDIKDIMLPVCLILAVIMTSVIFLMFILHEVFDWDNVTAWLSSSPGRMQDMIVLAGSLSADGATAHLIRHLSVIFLTPMILLISKKIGEKQVKELRKLNDR
ncbi:MAG: AbrB family transcriptional regulator [Dehalobacterium sp.]